MKSHRRPDPGPREIALASLLLLLPTACDGTDRSFSQYPGFADYFAAHPPAATVPSPADQALLARHRPRFFKAEGEPGPTDFYADYIAHGRLTDGDGRPVAEGGVTPEILNAHKDDPGAAFVHDGPPD